ncbi:uncharacterized protein G2W53_034769 [Senna tora]|uniref:RNase H type-1 domain-containing protein n=1 Tax=Senna tora TaxID=362788 RepID=A0A834T263_9FABA|nr:uncharacterized protein G2W53_034769 [Senna tora]
MGNHYSNTTTMSNTDDNTNYSNCDISEAHAPFAVVTRRHTNGGATGGAEVSGWSMQYTIGTKNCTFEVEASVKNGVENYLSLVFDDSACNLAHCGVKIEKARGGGGGLTGGIGSIRFSGRCPKNPNFTSTRTSNGCKIETEIFSYGCSFREGLFVIEKKKMMLMDYNIEGFHEVTLAHYYVTKDVGVSAVATIRTGDKGENFEVEVERPVDHPRSDLRMVIVETCGSGVWTPFACSHCVSVKAQTLAHHNYSKRKQFKEFLNNNHITIAWKIVTENHYLPGLNILRNSGIIQGDRNGNININRVTLECDSEEALELIKNGIADNHPCSGLVHCIRDCINRCWNVDLQHVYREANRAADLMAKLSHSLPEGLQYFDAPHAELGLILSFNLSGLLLPHLKPKRREPTGTPELLLFWARAGFSAIRFSVAIYVLLPFVPVKLEGTEFRVFANAAEECVMDSMEGQGFISVEESSWSIGGDCLLS